MEISLLVIGKTADKEIAKATVGYVERLRHYIPFRIEILPDVRNAGRMPEEQQKEAEGKLFLSKISASDRVVLLDERGKEYTSVEFSRILEKRMSSGLKRLIFIIGGPYGFSKETYDRADGLVSLSRMTFSHEMVRLFFAEQIYRAMTIMRGEPYHHS